MASKKNSRKGSASGGTPRSYSHLYKDDRSGIPSTPATAKKATTAAAPVQRESVNWQDEYSYVVRDLRQLGVVSVVILALIISIGLFL